MSLKYVINFAHLIELVKGSKDSPIFDKYLTHGDIKTAASTTGGVLRDSLPEGLAKKRTPQSMVRGRAYHKRISQAYIDNITDCAKKDHAPERAYYCQHRCTLRVVLVVVIE
jgi:hypothetical protein